MLEVRRVQAEREIAFRPQCQDCRFGPVRASDPDRCEHFAHWRISPDRRLSIKVTTGEARSESGLCGPDAVLFSPYAKWRLVPRWLARMDPQSSVMIAFYIALGTLAAGVSLFT
jgi:hypothetical protein